MNHRLHTPLLLTLLLTLLPLKLALPAQAQEAVRLLSYQGVLFQGGVPVTTATNVTFALFSDAGCTTAFPASGAWSQTLSVTPDAGGVFSAALGSDDPANAAYFDFAFDRALYLKTSVGGAQVACQAFSSAPYALGLYGLRIEPAGDPSQEGPNVVGGWSGNVIGASVEGATIAGGGDPDNGAGGTLPNEVQGDYGTVSGGARNTAGGPFATVGGGAANMASGSRATVGGGNSNTASGDRATVGGGSINEALFPWATVGGGNVNTASAIYATVGGGQSNTAGSQHATVGGGQSNTAGSQHATVSGGGGNTAGSAYATVGGGQNNMVSSGWATVGGGQNNMVSAERATVGGGKGNTASGFDATVSGGNSNAASGFAATVGGGWDNTAGGDEATVGGGNDNTASAIYATVGGGRDNTASGDYATVGGGFNNTTSASSAVVPGGRLNQAGGDYSFAAGNQAKVRDAATVGGGDTDGDEGTFLWADATNADFPSTGPNQFRVRASGGTTFFSDAAATVGVTLATGANTWASVSDSTRKERFRAADGERFLREISVMRLGSWNYREQDPARYRHYGPMAQDFFAAFGHDGVGQVGTDTTLATGDVDGVLFIAVQALEARTAALREAQARIEAQQAEITGLRTRTETLEREMASLQALVEAAVRGSHNREDVTATRD